ncbi:protein kinase [bacterium]|nr:protein kinase [bacterium]
MTDESTMETNPPKEQQPDEKNAKKRLALSIAFLTRRIDRPTFEKLRFTLEADPEFDMIAALQNEGGTLRIDPQEMTEAVENLVTEANPDRNDPERTIADLTEALTLLENTLGAPTFKDPFAPDDQATTEAGLPDNGRNEAIESFTISDRYQFIEFLKVGGQAVVCLALDVELNRTVAIKIPHIKGRSLESACRMIVVEARITGQLNHPAVIPIYALDKRTDGRPFLVLPYYPQGEFTRELRKLHPGKEKRWIGRAERALRLRSIVQSMVQLSRAVQSAHDRGIVHRDIKPGNILIGDHNEVFLADWGLAKNLRKPARSPLHEKTEPPSPSGSKSTEDDYTDYGGGTAIYMSKEQALRQLDLQNEKTDIFLLGATLYSMIYGRAPFADRTAAASYDVEFPRSPVSGIDSSLIEICKKAMAELQPDRYPTSDDLATDLERWLADQPLLFVKELPSKKIARFLRRQSRSIAAAAVMLMAGTVGLLIMNDRIATARDNETIAKKDAIIAQRKEEAARKETENALERETVAKDNAIIAQRKEEAARKETENALERETVAKDAAIVSKNKESAARKREADNFNLAFFVARIQFEVISQKLPFVPGSERIRFDVAETLCQTFENLMKMNPQRDDIVSFAIAAEREAGNMGRFVGELEIAQKHFERALDLCNRLNKKYPDNTGVMANKALVLRDFSHLFDRLGNLEAAEARCGEAIEIAKKLRQIENNPKFDELETVLLSLKCELLSTLGRDDEMAEILDRLEPLVEIWFGKTREPKAQDIKIAIGVKLLRANHLLRAEDYTKARDAFEKAFEQARANQDRDQDFRLLMGDAQFGKALALQGLNDHAAVRQGILELQQVFETMKKLRTDSPDVKVYADWVLTISVEMLRFERLDKHRFENALNPAEISKMIENRIAESDGPDSRTMRSQFLTELAYRENAPAKRQELAENAVADLDFAIEKLPLRKDFRKEREAIRKEFRMNLGK